MARVCLILPLGPALSLSADWVSRCRGALEGAGHSVDVVAVRPEGGATPAPEVDGVDRWLVAKARGLSSAAMTGLAEADSRAGAENDVLIVLTPDRGYHPDDLPRMVEPLDAGRAELAVARRVGDARRSPFAAALGAIARPVLGASDLFAELVAVSPAQGRAVCRAFDPVGARFAADLLFRSKGERVEVPVRVEGTAPRVALHLDDLRHLKRLADDRFGNASRLIQFCAVGASGMVVDLSCYAAFQLVFSGTWLAGRTVPLLGGPLDLAVSGALAIALALTWNFSLNRRLTFNDARHHGSIGRQYVTYALSNALGIALSFSLRLFLPAHVGFFQRHRLAAAVVGIVTATGISFSMSRWLVFRKRPAAAPARRHAPASASQALLGPPVSTS